jgi:hypothetical protein
MTTAGRAACPAGAGIVCSDAAAEQALKTQRALAALRADQRPHFI